MRKTFPVLLILLFAHSIILAQIENKNPAELNSKTTNATQQTDYSESVPYQSREFKREQKSKSKKEKKSKKDSQKESQTVQPIDTAQNNVNENSSVSENPIVIPVSVFDANGNSIQNLKKSDFKIFVDGQEQEISDFGVSDAPLNIILFLDTSPSTAYEFEELQKYATTLVGQLRPQDKVMVIAFNERAQVLADLTDDRQQINQAIKKAKFGDGTSLYEAVKYSLQKRINQINGRKFVIMLTDGVDTTSRAANFEDSLLEAERNDVPFFPVYLDTFQQSVRVNRNSQIISDRVLQRIFSQNQIGVRIPAGQPISAEAEYERGKQYLDDLAHLSGGRIITVKNFSKIDKTGFENIFEALKNQFYIGLNFSGNGVIGQRKQIKVRVNRPDLFVLARGSYLIAGN